MATNLALDPKLIDQVLELSGEPSNRAVTLALKEFIARRAMDRRAHLKCEFFTRRLQVQTW